MVRYAMQDAKGKDLFECWKIKNISYYIPK